MAYEHPAEKITFEQFAQTMEQSHRVLLANLEKTMAEVAALRREIRDGRGSAA